MTTVPASTALPIVASAGIRGFALAKTATPATFYQAARELGGMP